MSHGRVEITYLGGGDPAGTSVVLKHENIPNGLVIDPAPPQNGVIWSSADLEDDAVLMGDEYEIEFTVSSNEAFIGSIGDLTLTYLSWDEDNTTVTVDVPELKVQALDHFTLEGDVVAKNDDPGCPVEIIAWSVMPDGTEFEFPVQTFSNWGYEDFDPGVSITIQETPPNQATIFVTGGIPGDTGVIYATHPNPSIGRQEYSVVLTHGDADAVFCDVNGLPDFTAGQIGTIPIEIHDEWGNIVRAFDRNIYVKVLEDLGDLYVELIDLVGPNDPGYAPGFGYEGNHYYSFDGNQDGAYDILFRPFDAIHETTIQIQGDLITGVDPFQITVKGGPIQKFSSNILFDKMDESPENGYHAGNDLYIELFATDEWSNPAGYTAPLIVANDRPITGVNDPEPWAGLDEDFIIQMVDGYATNWPDDPIKIFKTADQVTLDIKSKLDFDINSVLLFPVRPNELAKVDITPFGDDDKPVEVPSGGTQAFDITCYDAYDNLIGNDLLNSVSWNADEGINLIGMGTDMNDNGVFEAIEYFGGESREGTVTVTVTDLRDGVIDTELPETNSVRVLNNYGVWLVEDEIWPNHILVGQDLDLKANIHYNTPGGDLTDLLTVEILFTLVDSEGVETEIHQKNVQLRNLIEEPAGVHTYQTTLPPEFFSAYLDHVRKGMPENEKKPNYLRVEILSVPGMGVQIEEYDRTVDDNTKEVELWRVAAVPATSPSFAPSVMVIGLALLGLAVGSTFFSGRKKKRFGKDDDAVSPVIAIILMVAITIVLAGVLWLWVSGLVATGKEETLYKGFQTEWIEKTTNNDYQLLVKGVDGKNELSVEDLRFTLYGLDKSDQTNGQHKVTNVYGKPIDDQTFISFRDGDHDGMLSIGDRFIIKSYEHVKDDGTEPEPDFQGNAKEGFIFELRAGKTPLFETQVN